MLVLRANRNILHITWVTSSISGQVTVRYMYLSRGDYVMQMTYENFSYALPSSNDSQNIRIEILELKWLEENFLTTLISIYKSEDIPRLVSLEPLPFRQLNFLGILNRNQPSAKIHSFLKQCK